MIRQNFMLFFRAKLHIIPKNTILHGVVLSYGKGLSSSFVLVRISFALETKTEAAGRSGCQYHERGSAAITSQIISIILPSALTKVPGYCITTA